MDDLTVDQIERAMRAFLSTYALPKLPNTDKLHLLNGFLKMLGSLLMVTISASLRQSQPNATAQRSNRSIPVMKQ